ncbi:hypothetical protein GGR24_002348 [Hansschlegelia beijingensis]|uniref:Uncharacterized protein n=1 Tax=Hansschlegelia beijingensis TaxID=1133344 RepID=A0A7W6D5U7_9HYPH|nr:hypothetical protein [Hansschlegelia beijingensis]
MARSSPRACSQSSVFPRFTAIRRPCCWTPLRDDPTARRRGVNDRLRHNQRLVKISRTTYAACPGGASQIPSAKAALHFARPVR